MRTVDRYAQYLEQHSICHAMLATVAAFAGGAGVYGIYSVLMQLDGVVPLHLTRKDAGLAASICLLPMLCWLEWRCRQALYPAKRTLVVMSVVVMLWIVVAKEASAFVYQPYLESRGWVYCYSYHIGRGGYHQSGTTWEVWAPDVKTCPERGKKLP